MSSKTTAAGMVQRVASISDGYIHSNSPSPLASPSQTSNDGLKSQPATVDTNATPTPKSPNDPHPNDTCDAARRKENNRLSDKAKEEFARLGEFRKRKLDKFHWFLVVGSLVTPVVYTIFFAFALARIGEPMIHASLSDALQNSYIESIIFIFLGGIVIYKPWLDQYRLRLFMSDMMRMSLFIDY